MLYIDILRVIFYFWRAGMKKNRRFGQKNNYFVKKLQQNRLFSVYRGKGLFYFYIITNRKQKGKLS
jgi:hypothetical protein